MRQSPGRIVCSHEIELPMPDSDGHDHLGFNEGDAQEAMPLANRRLSQTQSLDEAQAGFASCSQPANLATTLNKGPTRACLI